jgi:exonuclease III
LLVLTEYRDNAAGAILRAELGALGWQTARASKGPAYNGVLIASRIPFDSTRITPPEAATGELLHATLSDSTNLVGAYFPGNMAKRPFFARCRTAALASGSGPFLLIGDLNTGCNVRDVEPGASKFFCSDDFTTLETDVGLNDLWRRTRGCDAREWTWLSRVGNGYRLDHAFANAAYLARHSPVTATYLHDTREKQLSDHSALLVCGRS